MMCDGSPRGALFFFAFACDGTHTSSARRAIHSCSERRRERCFLEVNTSSAFLEYFDRIIIARHHSHLRMGKLSVK